MINTSGFSFLNKPQTGKIPSARTSAPGLESRKTVCWAPSCAWLENRTEVHSGSPDHSLRWAPRTSEDSTTPALKGLWSTALMKGSAAQTSPGICRRHRERPEWFLSTFSPSFPWRQTCVARARTIHALWLLVGWVRAGQETRGRQESEVRVLPLGSFTFQVTVGWMCPSVDGHSSWLEDFPFSLSGS